MINKILENTSDGLLLKVKIVPNSSKNAIILEDGFLKIKVTAPPVENKANKALVDFLAKKLHCAKSNISILKGELNKEKTLLIAGVDEAKFLSCIDPR